MVLDGQSTSELEEAIIPADLYLRWYKATSTDLPHTTPNNLKKRKLSYCNSLCWQGCTGGGGGNHTLHHSYQM